MIEKGKISASQMALLLYPTVIATGILLVPSITASHAKQDMWLSPLWAAFVGVLTVIVAIRLHRLYPKQTVIEYSESIAGKFFGKIIGLAYLFSYFHSNGIILREYGEFIVGNFLTRTPLLFIVGTMILVCALAIRGGLEVIARLAEMAVPVVVLVIFIFIVLLISDMDVNNMLPMLEYGIGPSVKGAIISQGWFSEFFLIAFLLPYVADEENSQKRALWSVAAATLTLSLINMTVLFVLGNITDRFVYPVMSAVRYISIADFLEHLEAFVMAIWVAGVFLKVAMFYYVFVLGMAQWLGLPGYRLLVFPCGFLIFVSAAWVSPSLMYLSRFLETRFPFYSSSIHLVLPLMLLLLAKWRKKKRVVLS